LRISDVPRPDSCEDTPDGSTARPEVCANGHVSVDVTKQCNPARTINKRHQVRLDKPTQLSILFVLR
jgi:hypothetical protein